MMRDRATNGGYGIVLLGLCFSLAANAQTPTLQLGSDVWPPFTNVPSETHIAIDLIEEALSRAEVRSATKVENWTSVMEGIRQGTYDGSGAIWHTPEREELLLFSEPYLENRLVLVSRKGKSVNERRLEDLAGKSIAVVERYAYGRVVEEASGPEFVAGRSDQDNLRKLLQGEVDYMLVDELLIRYVLDNQSEEAAEFLEVGTTPLVRRKLHFALHKDLPGAESIIEKFDAAIRSMLADGTYNEILQLHWIQADVDGDGKLELVPRDNQVGESEPLTGYSILQPEAPEGTLQLAQRFWIEGQVYEGWKNVPHHYKAPTTDRLLNLPPESTPIVRFKFRF